MLSPHTRRRPELRSGPGGSGGKDTATEERRRPEVRDSAVKGLRLPGAARRAEQRRRQALGPTLYPEGAREHLINMVAGLVGGWRPGWFGLGRRRGAGGGGLGASLLVGLGAAAVVAAPVALFALGMTAADRALANADPLLHRPDGRPRSDCASQVAGAHHPRDRRAGCTADGAPSEAAGVNGPPLLHP